MGRREPVWVEPPDYAEKHIRESQLSRGSESYAQPEAKEGGFRYDRASTLG